MAGFLPASRVCILSYIKDSRWNCRRSHARHQARLSIEKHAVHSFVQPAELADNSPPRRDWIHGGFESGACLYNQGGGAGGVSHKLSYRTTYFHNSRIILRY